MAAGSDGLSLCDDSCEAVSGEASVKRVLGLGGVFRGGRTVERSPAYQPCLLLAPGPACVAAAPRVAPPCLQSTLCNPLLRATPSTHESWASVKRAPCQRQRVQLRQRGRFGSGVVRATRARRELFGARDHSRRRHVHVTLRADGAELRCVATILR